MNPVIETILNHRSIRRFEERPLSEEQIRTIVACAQAASSSNNMQAYSIIGIRERETKRKLAEIVGQEHVEKNGHLFVFCADLHRLEIAGEMENRDLTLSLESAEMFMVALIDASLAAQNAALAAESMGLGICYIGGIRNDLEKVSALLQVPRRVLPLFGLAVGYPLQEPGKKPRLPFSLVYREGEYWREKEESIQALQEYDRVVSDYYRERTQGKRDDAWSGQMANMLKNPRRMYMKGFVQKQGFMLR